MSSDVSQTDLDFVTYGHGVIAFDKAEGLQAQTQAQTPGVRAIAQKLSDRADYFQKLTDQAAAEAGITMPNELPYDLRVRLIHMTIQHGLDFDKTYLADQIASHENFQSSLEAEASGGRNPKLKAIAQQAVPVVQDDLTQLRRLQQTKGMMM
jgi:putative membrane protein